MNKLTKGILMVSPFGAFALYGLVELAIHSWKFIIFIVVLIAISLLTVGGFDSIISYFKEKSEEEL